MISVAAAENIIRAEAKSYGTEMVPFEKALGRILAEDIRADRDLPPFNRVTMDGIAIRYEAFEKGRTTFKIRATQAAGDAAIDIQSPDECIEIMTGASLPETVDTVIRYEDVTIDNGIVTLQTFEITKGQNIHREGSDKKRGEIIAKADQVITPALIAVAASVGATYLSVKKLPRIIIITTGDELIEVKEQPNPFQIRKSNNYCMQAVLQTYGIQAGMAYLQDNQTELQEKLKYYVEEYDVLLLSGGISMGKFDYVPQVLETLSVQKLFHKVQQRPGKPFWFGKHSTESLVFAFPGNPVSTFMCLHRFFIPWLQASLGVNHTEVYAVLGDNVSFTPPLTYFLQAKLNFDKDGRLWALPLPGNGSGDFASLVEAHAFMELPAERNNFDKGEVFRIWPFQKWIE